MPNNRGDGGRPAPVPAGAGPEKEVPRGGGDEPWRQPTPQKSGPGEEDEEEGPVDWAPRGGEPNGFVVFESERHEEGEAGL